MQAQNVLKKLIYRANYYKSTDIKEDIPFTDKVKTGIVFRKSKEDANSANDYVYFFMDDSGLHFLELPD
jgi:hypothetical protein